jgi:branched-chain amino acid transport system permease protein
MSFGTLSGGSDLGAGVLVRILAAAVIARLVSTPLVVAAAVSLGILSESLGARYHSTVPFEASLFLIIGVVLFVQAPKVTRAAREQGSGWRMTREIRPIPRELRTLPAVRKWLRAAAVILTFVVVGLPWVLSPAQTTLTSSYIVFAIVGYSLLVLTGWAGQISLGQFGLAAVGAYVAAVSNLPLPFAVLLGGVAGSAATLVIGLPALRLRGLHLAIMTMAFHVGVAALLLNPDYLGRHLPHTLTRPEVLGVDFDDARVFYYVVVLALIAVALAVAGLRNSRTARVLLATRDNEQAAQAFGINITRARLGAFAVSGFIAAFGGALYAFLLHGVKADPFAPDVSINVFLNTVIGGLGTLAGPVIGSVYQGFPVLLALPSLLALLLTRPGGLVLLLLLPGGLGELFYDYRDRWLRRTAKRHRILVPSLLADMREDDFLAERAPLAVKSAPGGGPAFIPARYVLDDQWAIESAKRDVNVLRPAAG